MLCFDELCCAALRCAALRCAALRCAALRCAALRCAALSCLWRGAARSAAVVDNQSGRRNMKKLRQVRYNHWRHSACCKVCESEPTTPRSHTLPCRRAEPAAHFSCTSCFFSWFTASCEKGVSSPRTRAGVRRRFPAVASARLHQALDQVSENHSNVEIHFLGSGFD